MGRQKNNKQEETLLNADKLIDLVLKKTQANKLNWNRRKVQLQENTFIIELSESEQPLLTIICADDTSHTFKGAAVDQLYEEVLQQQFFEGAAGDLMDELAKL